MKEHDPIDPRQREAAAILLAAMELPIEVSPWVKQIKQAASIWPKMSAADGRIGNRRAALHAARALIDSCLMDLEGKLRAVTAPCRSAGVAAAGDGSGDG